jgi:hypothetical protein
VFGTGIFAPVAFVTRARRSGFDPAAEITLHFGMTKIDETLQIFLSKTGEGVW